MGCSICLEGYEENSEAKGTKPVALPCGHIFHKDCSDGWLRSCRMRSEAASCPLCKHSIGTGRALQLFPSDVNDFDKYLATRSRKVDFQMHPTGRHTPASVALDRQMQRLAQGELLGKLMDFRQHINAYIMGINNVSMSTDGQDERAYRLFADVSMSAPEKEAHFRSAMKALSSARDTFNEEVNNVQTLLLDAEQQHQRAHDRYKQATEMKKSLDHHMAIKEKEVQDMNKERSRVQRLEMYHMKELRDIEMAKQRLEAERKAILNEARAKEQAALKMRLESAQSIAQEKGNAQTEIDNMKGYVLEQERLRIDAENHAREMHSKNTFLADRMRVLSDKLDKARREVKQLKASSSTVKIEDGAATLPRSASPKRRRAESTLPPQSLSQLDDDGFVEVGCYRATPIKRARQSVEADDGAIIVLDDDDDDDFMNYPMPGFPHFTSI